MDDLIRREDVVEALYQAIRTTLTGTFTDSMSLAIAMTKNIPSAEPERTAKVERVSYGETLTYDFDGQCECGKWVDTLWQYCPSCGARLEWE